MRGQPWEHWEMVELRKATRMYDSHQGSDLTEVSMYSMIRKLKDTVLHHRSWESIRSKFRRTSLCCLLRAECRNEHRRGS